MKKWLLIVWVCCVSMLQAQERVDYKDIQSLTFFGVDYTFVRLYGVGEEPYQYKVLFRDMNNFFKSDAKTYDVKKYFGKNDIIISLEQTQAILNELDPNQFKVFNKEYNVSNEQIQEHIRSFNTGEAAGYGAVMLCTFLDRTKNRGAYYIIVFDIKSRQIIRNKSIEGKATGNNFQAYWGSSMLNALKQANK